MQYVQNRQHYRKRTETAVKDLERILGKSDFPLPDTMAVDANAGMPSFSLPDSKSLKSHIVK